MKSNYKPIGDYIQKSDTRNKDLSITNLKGLSMAKEFRKTTSNIVGTDLSIYKIVKQWQFACDFMSVIRVNKLPVVLNTDTELIIVSPAYPVFEIINHDVLLPEYLMMWFRRPEFDRYAFFKCDSAIRGGFGWIELCESELPVPSIEKQKAIVKEYDTVITRIKLNENLNKKLEETVQAIYKHWFVDFEFPDESGNPYKSSGGKMIFDEELQKEIPEGWEGKAFTKVVDLKGGGTPRTTVDNYWYGSIPFFTPSDVDKSFYTITTLKSITQEGLENCSSRLYPKNTVFVTARGTVGSVAIAGKEMAMNQSCYAISGRENFNQFFIHQLTLSAIGKLKKEAIGAVFNALVTKDFDEQLAIKPTMEVVKLFGERTNNIYNLLLSHVNQNIILHNMSRTLLARMAKG